MKKIKLILTGILLTAGLSSCGNIFVPGYSSSQNSVSSSSFTTSSSSASKTTSSSYKTSVSSGISSSSSKTNSSSSKTSVSSVTTSSSSKASTVSSSNSQSSSSEKISSSSSSIASSSTVQKGEIIASGSQAMLTILELNDLHGYAYASSYNASYNLANVKTYADSIRKDNNVVMIANGDMFQGTAFSNISHGKSVINAMNKMNFDMMGIGNHEFDWGLDEVLKYWNGNSTNGEANFPLVNGNVRDSNASNKLVGEDNEEDSIVPYTITYKLGGLSVGLLSYIGDQTSSICQNKFGSYYIDCYGNTDSNFLSKVKTHATKLKEMGADIVILNFHEGNSTGIDQLEYNKSFANMQDDDGNYLIDAVINGHTHTNQYGTIARTNGVALPVVQGQANCNFVGRTDLYIDVATRKVTSATTKTISIRNLGASKDAEVQNVLQSEYNAVYPQISEALAVSSNAPSKENLGTWAMDVVKTYTGSEVTFMNTGGIRSTGDISSGSTVTLEELYMINPFDNMIVTFEAKGSDIKNFNSSNGSYYYFNGAFDSSSLDSNTYYKCATIDYVFYGSTFNRYFSTKRNVNILEVCERDLMVQDLKVRNGESIDFSSYQIKIQPMSAN